MVLEGKRIKGVNLGSWLLMEGYILAGPNIAESLFKENFQKVNGRGELKKFERVFRDNFISEVDFRNISRIGANTVRVPFNYRLLEDKPYSYSSEGFQYLDKVFAWSKKYGLRVILDLHAAAGSQNCDWHSDSRGKAGLWESSRYRERTFCLWEAVADRFKDEPALLGYDVLNEPVLGKERKKELKQFYQALIRRIRRIDKQHLLFIEGNTWAQDIDFLKDLIAANIHLSIHTYLPLSYTFNFRPFYRFPGRIEGVDWDKSRIYRYLEPYYKFSRKNRVKIFVGEFGINWRGGFWGELKWLKAILEAYEDFEFGYTYWTYKAVAGPFFPDGLYQYIDNSKYVNRPGPLRGWDVYPALWKKEKREIADFFKTLNFTPNRGLITLLSQFFRR